MASQNLALALAELSARRVETGHISDGHRYVLSQALNSAALKEAECIAISRLLKAPSWFSGRK
ncbi:MAG: hypothetical protein ACFBSG_19500 [Leptolyngbyaceae cyanobacterium]